MRQKQKRIIDAAEIRAVDKQFEAMKERNPGLTFAQYYSRKVASKISQGQKHASLGKNLEGTTWEDAGIRDFHLIRSVSGIRPASKVVDYGCGSLRIGIHLTRFLDADNYLGFDVIPDFIEEGKKLIGPDLIAQKRPDFRLIGTDTLHSNQADLVFASAVAFHVHPDELLTFGRNVCGLASKPGCIVLFDALLHETEFRYSQRGWARSIGIYCDALAGLRFIGMHEAETILRGDYKFLRTWLEFQREK